MRLETVIGVALVLGAASALGAICWNYGVRHGQEMCRDVQAQQLTAIDKRTAAMWQQCHVLSDDLLGHVATSDLWIAR